MKIEDLEIYQLAREISKETWPFYDNLDWRTKKTIEERLRMLWWRN